MKKTKKEKRNEKAKTLIKKATNSHQYDSPKLNWSKEKETPSPVRQAFEEYLKKYIGNLIGKSVIDIGSGTGHLSKFFFEKGAKEVYGIEPSHRNVKISKKLFPRMSIVNETLEDVKLEKSFDIATVILTFEHMKNLNLAFNKIAKLIKIHGKLYAIIGDKEYNTTPRFGYKLTVENLDKGEIVVATKRQYGTMYDIFRPVSNFIETARGTGFLFKKHIPLIPTKKLIQSKPRYKQFKGRVTNHLLMFEYIGKS